MDWQTPRERADVCERFTRIRPSLCARGPIWQQSQDALKSGLGADLAST